jgi:hypothetical protein
MPPMTEQEDIASLRGQAVPDADGFSFGELAKNGDIFDVEIVRDSDSAPVGTARGITVDELAEQARTLAAENAGG